MDYTWDFRVVGVYQAALWRGLLVSVAVTAACILPGTLLGIVLALMRTGRLAPTRLLASGYIELFRAIPLLVLLVWLYYCLPIVTGIALSAFWVAVLGMSLNLAAFAAETLRAGVEAVPRPQVEAGLALGMTNGQVTARIVLPQAARIVVPPMVSLYITMLKLSSLASAIAVYELLHSADNIISQTYRPFEVYTAVALAYAVIVIPASLLSRRFETAAFRRLAER